MLAASGEQGLVAAVDYDSTLYNSPRVATDLWTMVGAMTGQALEEVAGDAINFRLSELGSYDFDGHMQLYGLDQEEMWQHFGSLVQTGAEQSPPDYIYPDSAPFVQALMNENYGPHILTFGLERFQLAKIIPNLGHLTGVYESPEKLLPVEVVQEPKGRYLARKYPGRRGFLVDDKPNQQLPAGFTEINLNREEPLDSPLEIPGGFQVYNLDQAMQVIRSLSGE